MSWLEKIRNKSEAEKTFMAFWIALIITVVLVTVWSFSLSYRIDENNKNNQIASPLSAISARIKDIFSDGREIYQAK